MVGALLVEGGVGVLASSICSVIVYSRTDVWEDEEEVVIC